MRLLYPHNRVLLPGLARRVRKARLTYLSRAKFLSLANEIDRVRREKVTGDFCELGVALGGSAIYIASQLEPGRRFGGFDVFGMIPPPSERDGDDTHDRYRTIAEGRSAGIDGDPYYGYIEDLYDRVVLNFSRFGLTVDGERIALFRGLFQDTLPLRSGPVAFAHIDCDWHDAVAYCLETLAPSMSPGGAIIVDDYNDYQGCREAVDTHLSNDPSLMLKRTRPHAVLQKLR